MHESERLSNGALIKIREIKIVGFYSHLTEMFDLLNYFRIAHLHTFIKRTLPQQFLN